MGYLIILSFLTIASYTLAVCLKQGRVPYSISATFYRLEHKKWFSASMAGTALLLMPAVLELSRPGTECWAFLACAGMLMIGCAPNFKDKQEGTVHDIGAILTLVCSQIWVGCNQPWLLLLWVAYSIYTLIYMMTNGITGHLYRDFMSTRPMFWVEVTAIVSVFATAFTLL